MVKNEDQSEITQCVHIDYARNFLVPAVYPYVDPPWFVGGPSLTFAPAYFPNGQPTRIPQLN